MSRGSFAESPVALITGVTGQDGSYLAEFLLEKGYTVWGMVRRSSTSNTERIEHLLQTSIPPEKSLNLCFGDLADAASLVTAIRTIRPTEVYNLAAQSHVGVSFQMPEYTADITGLGAVRMLQAIRELGLPTRFYQASSSEMFGRAPSPQNEATPINPCNPYGAAKALALHVSRIYRESYGLYAANGILFNHESPRRGETFVTRKITLAVGRIARGSSEPLRLGNLDSCRDWGFAGDYVEAMWRMLQLPEPDDFVIATGETHSVREFCELAFAHAGLPIHWEGTGLEEQGRSADGRLLVTIDPQYFRPRDIDQLLGDASHARAKLGWEPSVTFTELVRMMVDADL
ncbi:MAG: GDP-mannose 4,6-dehydratase [Planctomycetaceae bacterium]